MTRSPRERALTLRQHEVRAVLAGATQHWVPVRPQPDPEMPIEAWRQDGHGHWYGVSRLERTGGVGVPETEMLRAPLDVGDRAWVRETWQAMEACPYPDWSGEERIVDVAKPERGRISYRANEPEDVERWRSAATMPRWASRLLLEVTAVRVARIQDVTEENAIAMGVDGPHHGRWRDGTGALVPPESEPPRKWAHSVAVAWERMHGRGAWDRNDWCWARTFRRVEGP